MANVTDRVPNGLVGNPSRKLFVLEAVVDFSKWDSPAVNDYWDTFVIPEGTLIISAGAAVDPGRNMDLTGVMRVDFGFSANPDYFIDGAVINSSLGRASVASHILENGSFTPNAVFETGDQTRLTIVSASGTIPTRGAIRVFAVCVNVNALGDIYGEAATRDHDPVSEPAATNVETP